MNIQNLLLSETGYPQVPQLIHPVPVERDGDGYWTHPGVPDFDESHEEFQNWVRAQGLTVSVSSLESEDGDHPAFISYYDDETPSVLQWLPTQPVGDGWFTLSIHDSEDGPAWVWARREPVAVDKLPAASASQSEIDVLKDQIGTLNLAYQDAYNNWQHLLSSRPVLTDAMVIAKSVLSACIDAINDYRNHENLNSIRNSVKRLDLGAIIAATSAQPAGDAQDAARYRYLRNEAWGCGKSDRTDVHVCHLGVGVLLSSVTELAEEALDTAVDAAMSAAAQGE